MGSRGGNKFKKYFRDRVDKFSESERKEVEMSLKLCGD